MIQPNELRIGNYILDDEGLLAKIIGFCPFEHSYRCDEKEGCNLLIDVYPEDGTIREGYEVDINFCKPIELTEEWLLKFGFIKGRFDNYVLILDNEFSKISYWSNSKKIELSNTSQTTWGSVNCMYLHQLQNLYFALTGEELKINNFSGTAPKN